MDQRQRNALYVATLFVILTLFAAGFVVLRGIKGARGDQRPATGGDAGAELTERAGRRFTVLVLGTDNVEGSSRSDTMVLAMVDTAAGAVSVLSIPRDTLAEIPGHGRQKITHAFAFGGPSLSVATVESLLGMNVDYYVVFNFASFERLVDSLGGVYVDVPRRMRYTDRAGGLYIDLKPGLQRLDGKQALGYVRFRDSEGDIGRVGRQVGFIKAVAKELVDPGIVTRLPGVLWSLLGLVDTNVPATDVARMVRLTARVDTSGMKAFMVPGEPSVVDGVSYWVTDPAAVAQVLREFGASSSAGHLPGLWPGGASGAHSDVLGGNG